MKRNEYNRIPNFRLKHAIETITQIFRCFDFTRLMKFNNDALLQHIITLSII